MNEVFEAIGDWVSDEKKVALATVIQTWGSSPQPAGAKMVVSPSAKMVGSVSGGCVEGAVVEEALEVMKTEEAKLVHFGVSDETAWEVGLACGGELDILVQPVSLRQVALYDRLQKELRAGRSMVLIHVLEGQGDLVGQSWLLREDGELMGTEGSFAAEIGRRASELLHSDAVIVEDISTKDLRARVYFESHGPPLNLIIVGGVHVATYLTGLASLLGYQVYVIDPRSAFGSSERFPEVVALHQEWPEKALSQIGITANTAVAVLTHDPKIDDPALKVALKSRAFYIGALGSRKTQEARRRRLRASGLGEKEIGRLHGPIGLDLRGRSPSEIALSIMAEIVAVRSGSPLTVD
jgi:xanthine dehydrogenase accessory factor